MGDRPKKKVLFVDDEEMILRGLGRMLRGKRGEWDIAFADSGPKALAMMTERESDVVVCDLRMPGMNGAELLAAIKERYPHAVRIVLSGQSDKETALRAVRIAHQFLQKPCDGESLVQVISRACALSDMLGNVSLRRIVSQVDTLPSLPSLFTALITALESPHASIDQIGQLVSRDVSMTAKILQLVNSAFFGSPQKVGTPSEAVTVLGFETVKTLVLVFNIFAQYRNVDLTYYSMEWLWTHSLMTGILARDLARSETKRQDIVDFSFTAGVVHDIGKLVLAANLPDDYHKVWNMVNETNMSFYKAEELVFGTNHAAVGAYLMGLWGLPEPIIESVAFHHSPELADNPELSPLTAVHAADILDQQNFAHDRIIGDFGFSMAYLDRLGLTGRIPDWSDIAEAALQYDVSDLNKFGL